MSFPKLRLLEAITGMEKPHNIGALSGPQVGLEPNFLSVRRAYGSSSARSLKQVSEGGRVRARATRCMLQIGVPGNPRLANVVSDNA